MLSSIPMLLRLKPVVRDLLVRVLYAAGITQPAASAREKLTVVTFHRVLPAAQREQYPLPGIAVTPEELGFCLDIFLQHFACGPLCEIAERHSNGERFDRPPLAITFDDGQLDNFLHARPVLERRGARASFFVPIEAIDTGKLLWHDRMAYALAAWLRAAPVVASKSLGLSPGLEPEEATRRVLERAKSMPAERRLAWVGEIEQRWGERAIPAWDGMMSWEQLRELAGAGHEVGSHSMTHPILPLCSDEELVREIEGSRDALTQRMSTPPETFCYPNGDHDARSVERVHRAGYRWGVTTRSGLNARGALALELRRCDIDARRVRSRHGELAAAHLAWRLSGLPWRLGSG